MGLNKGQLYELKIRNLIASYNWSPKILNLNGNDAAFRHNNIDRYLEVKNESAPDYGQSELTWSANGGWQWANPNGMTALYDQISILSQIPKFTPKRFTIPQHQLTAADRIWDGRQIAMKISLLDRTFIQKYYAGKNCYYIQIEGKGFYHLEQDVANLVVPKFDPELYLRIRMKHRGGPDGNYGFLAVLMVNRRTIGLTKFDLEAKPSKQLPPIVP